MHYTTTFGGHGPLGHQGSVRACGHRSAPMGLQPTPGKMKGPKSGNRRKLGLNQKLRALFLGSDTSPRWIARSDRATATDNQTGATVLPQAPDHDVPWSYRATVWSPTENLALL